MIGTTLDALAMLKEYGLAGVLAWLFWWTLRRMMASHDSTVRGLKDQLRAQMETARATGESFAQVIQNHMGHLTESLARFDVCLTAHAEDQRRWQDRLLDTLNKIAARLGAERGA